MSGKWHLGHENGALPVNHGFDRSYVLDASGADNWEQKPYIPYYATAPWFEDGLPATLPDDFYSSDFIIGKMLDYLKRDHTDPRPFFSLVSFQAIHIPVQAPPEITVRYIETYKDGWDDLRQRRWRRAQELGLVSAQLSSFYVSRNPKADMTCREIDVLRLARLRPETAAKGIGAKVGTTLDETGLR